MQSDPTRFIPVADDQEFVGRFESFSSWRILAIILMTVLSIVCVSSFSTRHILNHDSLDGISELLDRAVSSSADESIVLIGDSVLRGRVMKAHGIADWERFTVSANMRDLFYRELEVAITDLSLDGLLPGDLLAILMLLEARDPVGRVRVVIELSPRYLSTAYSKPESAFSREFLRDVVNVPPNPSFAESLRDLVAGLGLTKHRLGLLKLREALPSGIRNPGSLLRPTLSDESPEKDEPEQVRREMHRARVAPHFLLVDATDANIQTKYMREAAGMLATSGRDSLFFLTPIDEYYLVPTGDISGVLNATSPFRRLLSAGESGSNLSYFNFNDHAFEEELFLDHCHLTPEGNRLLAQRLLRALSIPLAEAPPSAGAPHDLGAAQAFVLGAVQLGLSDGVGSQVHFRARKELAVVRPGFLYVCDTGNARICEIHVASRSCETLFDGNKAKGSTPFCSPGFAPGPILADGKGGAYFLDLRSAHIGQVDHKGVVRCLTEETPWRTKGMQLKLANFGQYLLVYEGVQGTFYEVDPTSGRIQALDRVSIQRGLRSIVEDPGGRMLALDEGGSLVSLDLDPIEEDSTKKPLVLASADQNRAAAFWAKVTETFGIKPNAKLELALSDPSQLFCAGDRLYINDHVGEFNFCWRIQLANNTAFPLLMPGRDGLLVLGPYARITHEGSWTASDDGMLFWLSSKRSFLYRFREYLFGRSSWDYSAKSAPLSLNAITSRGLTHGTRRAGHYRVGVFGSSMLGANLVTAIPMRKDASSIDGSSAPMIHSPRLSELPLASTQSFPLALDRALRGQLSGHPIQVDVLDFTLPRASLVQQFVAVVAQDPLEIDMAIFSFDRGMTRVDKRWEINDPVQQWRRLARDENGLPEVAWLDDSVPAPVWLPEDETKKGILSPSSTAIDCFTEMIDYCQARGILPVLVDIACIDERGSLGFAALNEQQLEIEDSLRELFRERGVVYISPRASFLAHSGERHPFSAADEHHLTGDGQDDLGVLVASRLRRTIETNLYNLDERLAERRKHLASEVGRAPLAPLLNGIAIDKERAGVIGVDAERVRVLRAIGNVTVIADFDSSELLLPWRSALAAFGLAGVEKVRQGDTVTIRAVRYTNHDEYGEGVADSVEFLGRFVIGSEDLPRALLELSDALDGEEAPDWLKSIPQIR